MAIAFRSGTEALTNAATSLAINVPAGVVDGDVLVLHGVTADGDDGGFNTLSGWTQIVNNVLTGGAAPSPPGVTAWWRVASSEPASYTITPTAGSTGICAQMMAFTGVDNTTPIDATTTTATGDSTNSDPAAITTVTDEALTIVSSTNDTEQGVATAVPSGYTAHPNGSVVTTGGGNGAGLFTAYRSSLISPAGSENPGTFTMSTEQWVCTTIALRPGVAFTREQDSFRFYEDGTESGAVAIDTQNTDVTRARETITQLRVGAQMVGDAPAESGELQYKETSDAASEWRKVP